MLFTEPGGGGTVARAETAQLDRSVHEAEGIVLAAVTAAGRRSAKAESSLAPPPRPMSTEIGGDTAVHAPQHHMEEEGDISGSDDDSESSARQRSSGSSSVLGGTVSDHCHSYLQRFGRQLHLVAQSSYANRTAASTARMPATFAAHLATSAGVVELTARRVPAVCVGADASWVMDADCLPLDVSLVFSALPALAAAAAALRHEQSSSSGASPSQACSSSEFSAPFCRTAAVLLGDATLHAPSTPSTLISHMSLDAPPSSETAEREVLTQPLLQRSLVEVLMLLLLHWPDQHPPSWHAVVSMLQPAALLQGLLGACLRRSGKRQNHEQRRCTDSAVPQWLTRAATVRKCLSRCAGDGNLVPPWTR